MLVQFKMKNVLSFKEETIFDMTAISAYKEHPSNLIDIRKIPAGSGYLWCECQRKVQFRVGPEAF